MVKTGTWTTKWGIPLLGLFREGKSDWNTNQAIIKEDEYFFDRLKPIKVGLDIGAHIGAASLAMASQGAKVVAVEALPENFNMILESVALNKFQNRITVLHKAIGARDGDMISIHYGNIENEIGDVHEFIGNSFPNPNYHGRSVDVETVSLDTVFRDNDIQHCDVVKIDCEGGEWPCFEGVSPEILDKIDWIVGELHCSGPYVRKSRQDFLDLLQNKFEDKSVEFGLATDIQGAQGLSSFVFKRR